MARRKLNTHHVKPKSRIPDHVDKNTDNTVEWDERFHAAFHYCFGNMTVEEIHHFLDIVTKPGTSWNSWQLERMRDLLKRAQIKEVA